MLQRERSEAGTFGSQPLTLPGARKRGARKDGRRSEADREPGSVVLQTEEGSLVSSKMSATRRSSLLHTCT